MTEEKFKLPNSSYEELVKIIKGYGHMEKPASLTDVSHITGLHTTIVSRNAGFLIGTEILEPGAKKTVTGKGKKLAQALEYNIQDNIREAWREIIRGSEFLSKILTAIKIRNGMDQATLETHIAYSAGQPKKPQFMTGARTIIDILLAALVVKETDGIITITNDSDISTKIKADQIGQQKESIKKSIKLVPPDINSNISCQVNIELRIECKPNEIEGLGAKLRDLIKDFSRPCEDDNKDQNIV